MASTEQRMELARKRRCFERQLAKLQNTTTWVDESYGTRLARQFFDKLAQQTTRIASSLSNIRSAVGYVCETSDEVVYVITDDAKEMLYFLRFGKSKRDRHKAKVFRVVMSRHATVRLFERLRTNANWDVKFVLSMMIVSFNNEVDGLPLGHEGSFTNADGVFHYVIGTSKNVADPVAIVKTFIAHKPT